MSPDGSLYLADKSAHAQRYRSADAAAALDQRMADGTLAVCEIVALELLYSARGPADYERLHAALDLLPWLSTTNAALRRALDIQRKLAACGHHRRPIPDLLVAATAAEYGATVLHYDRDFDMIAEITDQPTEWIVPRGSAG